MNPRKTGFFTFLFGVFFLVCACGGSYKEASSMAMIPAEQDAYNMARAEPVVPAAAEAAALESGYGNAGTGGEGFVLQAENPARGRKLVKQADLRLRVEKLDETEKLISALAEKYGAWFASTAMYENSRHYGIRVPSPSYDAMLADLTGIGRTLMRSENAEDVTLRYYDLEARLATKRELLTTYQSYLGKAANIEEILSVESRIADLQQEIDHTGTQFRNLAGLIDYSTIELEIAGPVAADSYAGPTIGEKLKALFKSFGGVASSAVVVLAGIVMYGVPAVLVAVLLFWLLFGRVGLLKKLWALAAGKKAAEPAPDGEK